MSLHDTDRTNSRSGGFGPKRRDDITAAACRTSIQYTSSLFREVQTALGYGMRLDTNGDHVPVSMSRATGRQLIDEVVGQLGMERRVADVRMTTSARSVLLPYVGSPLAPRSPGDRPPSVPDGARNFAFLGQYVEIPGEVASRARPTRPPPSLLGPRPTAEACRAPGRPLCAALLARAVRRGVLGCV